MSECPICHWHNGQHSTGCQHFIPDESPDGGCYLWARRKRGSGSLDVLYVVGELVWSLRWHGPTQLADFHVLGQVAPPATTVHLAGAHDAPEGT